MQDGDEIRIGLRFKRSDVPALQGLVQRARAGEVGVDAIETFVGALEAARTGEPLIVVCTTPMEAAMMAAGYTQFGVSPPAIESLSGDSSGARTPGG